MKHSSVLQGKLGIIGNLQPPAHYSVLTPTLRLGYWLVTGTWQEKSSSLYLWAPTQISRKKVERRGCGKQLSKDRPTSWPIAAAVLGAQGLNAAILSFAPLHWTWSSLKNTKSREREREKTLTRIFSLFSRVENVILNWRLIDQKNSLITTFIDHQMH